MGICQSSPNLTNINNYPLFSFNGLITKAYVCDIYDGDTITCIFKFNGQDNRFKIRMYGYDSPEMKPPLGTNKKEEKERDKIIENALLAKKYLAELILNKWIILECGNFDKYGRILGKIKINKNDESYVNDDMISKGHGYPYFGKTKKN